MPNDASERRADQRVNVNMEAVIFFGEGGSTAVVVRNLSCEGCLIDARGLGIGESALELALPGQPPLPLTIVHFDGVYFGCRFGTTIDEASFAFLVTHHAQNRPQLL